MGKRVSVDELEEDEAAKIASAAPGTVMPGTRDSDDYDNIPDGGGKSTAAKPRVAKTVLEHECGLPEIFVGQEESKKKLCRYLEQWNFTPDINSNDITMEYTQKERDLYEVYRRGETLTPATKEFFVTALRLWKSGRYPLSKQEMPSINTMKVN